MHMKFQFRTSVHFSCKLKVRRLTDLKSDHFLIGDLPSFFTLSIPLLLGSKEIIAFMVRT